ncbi:MAG TPA: ATP-binding protein [Trebonia sp.]|nr:ATP-binding protein [Trebonia sp.]
MRRTIRLRLTLLYGGMFLGCGAVLLAVVYLLVSHGVLGPKIEPPSAPSLSGLGGPAVNPQVQQLDVGADLAREHEAFLRELLLASLVALLLLAVASVWLGWLMTGRALRPLRAMAVNAKAISATDLHLRLAAPGPQDEIKELADIFDGLLSHLQDAFEAQRRFVANASHELRTPLTFERSLLEVTLADPDVDAKRLLEVCSRLLENNGQQERLIEALLTLARSQRGLDRRVPVDLAVPAKEHLSSVREADAPDAPDGVRIEAQLAPAFTSGDPALVARLITNLIDNALRHNVPDGWVRVTTGTVQGRPTMRVANSGPRVAPDQIERIFQPFQRLHATRTGVRAGQGIGLSIVAAIAATHDAEVRAVPRQEGGGLEVSVVFPAALVPAAGGR